MTPLELKRKEATRLRASGMTFAAIGDRLGVTGERARQLLLPVRQRTCRSCGLAVGPRKQYHLDCRPSDRRVTGSRVRRLIDLTNRRFGLWTVLLYTGAESRWLCRCQCGREQAVRGDVLRSGRSQACRRCAALQARRPCTIRGYAVRQERECFAPPAA